MNEHNVSVITTFLTAYAPAEVDAALAGYAEMRERAAQEAEQRVVSQVGAAGWERTELAPDEVPYTHEYMVLNGITFVRAHSVREAIRQEEERRISAARTAREARRPKTDTSVQPVRDLRCPLCGSELFKEGICPACEDGKKGFRIRLLCGDCDYVLLL